jgi:hypothetical protein
MALVTELEAPGKPHEFSRALARSSTSGIDSDVGVGHQGRLAGVGGDASVVAIRTLVLTFKGDGELTSDLDEDMGDVAHGAVGQLGDGPLPYDILKDDVHTRTGHRRGTPVHAVQDLQRHRTGTGPADQRAIHHRDVPSIVGGRLARSPRSIQSPRDAGSHMLIACMEPGFSRRAGAQYPPGD